MRRDCSQERLQRQKGVELLREALWEAEFETGAMIVGVSSAKTKNPKIVTNELIDQLRDSDGT